MFTERLQIRLHEERTVTARPPFISAYVCEQAYTWFVSTNRL